MWGDFFGGDMCPKNSLLVAGWVGKLPNDLLSEGPSSKYLTYTAVN